MLLFDCEKATSLMTEFEEGALSWSAALGYRMHLAHCHPCRVLASTSGAVAGIISSSFHEDVEAFQPEGREALAAAMLRLGTAAKREPVPFTPVPAEMREKVSSDSDEPLSLMALAHYNFFSVVPRSLDPLLPEEFAEKLPRRETWNWRRSGKLRIVELAEDVARGIHLSMLFVPPGHRIPVHSHPGSESILLLDGEMTDARSTHVTGEWIHYGAGMEHSSVAGEDGCWCLVREEGFRQF